MNRFSGLWRLILAVLLFIGIPAIALSRIQSDHILRSFEDEEHGLAVANLKMVKDNNESLLRSITSKTITISEDDAIAGIGGISRYSDLFAKADDQILALQAQNFLAINMYDMPEIASIYLYQDGADYLVAAPAGVWRLDSFYDADWQDEYAQFQNSRKVCFPRKSHFASGTDSTVNVVTFFYKLAPLSNQVNGVLLVNIYQNAIDAVVNRYNDRSSGEVSIVDDAGTVVSSNQTSLFETSIAKTEVFKKIADGPSSGYVVEKLTDGSHIYTYVKSDYNNWIYIKDQPLDSMVERSKSLAGFWVTVSNIVLLAGLLLTVLVIYRTYAPIRRFVRELLKSAGKSGDADEYTLLTRTFQTMREQQSLLHEQLQTYSKEFEGMFILDVLRGNIDQYKDQTPCDLHFHGSGFVVGILSIDSDMQDFTAEEWSYLRLSLQKTAEEAFAAFGQKEPAAACTVLFEKTDVAVLVNISSKEGAGRQALGEVFAALCKKAAGQLGVSVSAGVGGRHEGLEQVSVSTVEAQTALGRRLFEGSGRVHFWQPGMNEEPRFFFPYDAADRIQNHLPDGDVDAIAGEIDRLVEKMCGIPGLQRENMLNVFNQMVSAAIRFLIDNKVNINDLPPAVSGVYANLSSAFTIDSASAILKAFYQEICAYSKDEQNKGTYFNRIVQYFKEHYQHDINFEAVAEEIGISYSYLRRLIKEATDKTALEYLTEIRIDEARRLLLTTELTLREISERVGFSNIQSFHRFFKKQVGVTAGEFRKAAAKK